jgi:hypothetical protein
MVQTTQTRHRNHGSVRRWPLLDVPLVRSVLGERIMNAIVVMISDVFANQPSEMAFIQSDDVVEKLSPAASDPPFGESILPRRLDARPLGFQTRRLQERDHLIVEFRVSIQDHIAIRGRLGKCFAQLLDNPVRVRVLSHVEVQDLASSMLYDE